MPLLQYLRKTTTVELLAILGIAGALGLLLLWPDSATSTRWGLERRARNWKPSPVSGPADATSIATQIDITGEWSHRQRLASSSFTFTKRSEHQYAALFATSGCLGGCQMARIASVQAGIITLDGAVAEYLPRTYNTLYAVHVDQTDYLVPDVSLRDFEQALSSGSEGWKFYVFSRTSWRRDKSVK